MDPQTATVIVSLIGAIVSIITAVLAYKASVNAKEAKVEAAASTAQSKINETKIDASDVKQAKAIEVVRSDVNDKMQQFLALTKTSSHAEGVKDELERVK
jgi:hypothetical protein